MQTGHIDVIGPIWWPTGSMAATTYNVSDSDVANMRGEDGKITRDSVASWLDCHAGDFQCVTDFAAEIRDPDRAPERIREAERQTDTYHSLVFDWTDDESELTFNDCMFPPED